MYAIAKRLLATLLISLLLMPSVARADDPSSGTNHVELKEVHSQNDDFLRGCGYYKNKSQWEQDKNQREHQKAWAVIYNGVCKDVIWAAEDQKPTDNEKINDWIKLSAVNEAMDRLDDIQVPRARIEFNPWLGLVNVPTWFWIRWKDGYNPDATDGSEYLTNKGSTWLDDVYVRVKPVKYIWSFGDSSKTYKTDSAGKPYPEESNIKHLYTQSTVDRPEGYRQSVIIVWRAEYRTGDNVDYRTVPSAYTTVGIATPNDESTDDSAYQPLATKIQILTSNQRVQQSQSVLTDPNLSSRSPQQPDSWWDRQPYSEPITFLQLNGLEPEKENPFPTFGHTALDLIGIFDPFGIADGINALWYLTEGDYVNAAISVTGMIPYMGDLAKVGKYTVKGSKLFSKVEKAEEGVKTARNVEKGGKDLEKGKPPVENTARNPAVKCAASFSPNTPVSTSSGLVPISTIQRGDEVLAYNLNTRSTGYYPVSRVVVHQDPVIVELTISGEGIGTTPEHPFWTSDRWKDAGKLSVGAKIRNADGGWGTVQNVYSYAHPQRMYNLTVPGAHTFFVGNNQWLVHNDCANGPSKEGKIDQNNSEIQKASDTANNYKLSNEQFNNHILARHGPSSSIPGKSKFNQGFDIRNGIDNTLKSPDSLIKPNTNGRSGYIFEHTYSSPIGVDKKGRPLKTLKVVIDDKGNVITAYPVR